MINKYQRFLKLSETLPVFFFRIMSLVEDILRERDITKRRERQRREKRKKKRTRKACETNCDPSVFFSVGCGLISTCQL